MPPWLDRTAYPFCPSDFATGAGRMSYVDEGDGEPVVMLHGNPTWSFLFRHLIRHLAPRFRCIAPDYLGFGLSDKPSREAFSYAPPAHATHVEALIEHLGLEDVTLVMHDWGGPIGCSYATEHPDHVRRLVIMNTWMWPLKRDWKAFSFSTLAGGPLGRIFIERFDAFSRLVMPLTFGHRQRLSSSARAHYRAPASSPADRIGHWVFPRALTDETEWLASLWDRRDRLAGMQVLLLWGEKDPAFGNRMDRWHQLFPDAEIGRLQSVGHYVPEETGPALGPPVEAFLRAR